MSTCAFFAQKEVEVFFLGTPVENCGRCINWCEERCLHQEKLVTLCVDIWDKTNIHNGGTTVHHNDGRGDDN